MGPLPLAAPTLFRLGRPVEFTLLLAFKGTRSDPVAGFLRLEVPGPAFLDGLPLYCLSPMIKLPFSSL